MAWSWVRNIFPLPSSWLHPALMHVAAVMVALGKYLWAVIMLFMAPASLTTKPLKPHSVRAISVNSRLLAQDGTPFSLTMISRNSYSKCEYFNKHHKGYNSSSNNNKQYQQQQGINE